MAEYEYDGLGRRIVKKTYSGGVLSETRHQYWSAGRQLLEERVGVAPDTARVDTSYVWGVRYLDELVSRDRDTTPGTAGLEERLFAVHDAQFSVTALVNTSGAVVERYDYNAYGQRLIFDNSWAVRATSSFASHVGHQGLYHDPETGLIHNRARYRHPTLGRWVGRDPLGYVDGMSVYESHGSAPTLYVDPAGTDYFTYRIWQDDTQVCWSISRHVEQGALGSLLFGGGSYEQSMGAGCTDYCGDEELEYLRHQYGVHIGGAVDQMNAQYAADVLTDAAIDMAMVTAEGALALATVGVGTGAKAGIVTTKSVTKASGTYADDALRNGIGFVGRQGDELANATFQPVRNQATTINGREYSRHAIDQMQNRGLVPSAVENTINHGARYPTRQGTKGFYDSVNNMRVIVNDTSGKVVTAIRGAP